jgi:hypothetical protein
MEDDIERFWINSGSVFFQNIITLEGLIKNWWFNFEIQVFIGMRRK